MTELSWHNGPVWTVADSVGLASEYVAGTGRRWRHLTGVGALAEHLAEHSERIAEDLVSAAWLHDIGYAPTLATSGFHPLDGARFLVSQGLPDVIVGLVAHHTGAAVEAKVRGLDEELSKLPTPDAGSLDLLTMIDLAVGPDGRLTRDVDRLVEILDRYDRGDPVHEAVTVSGPALLGASARGKALLGLPDDWPLIAGERMSDA